jgi:hypothetical protein
MTPTTTRFSQHFDISHFVGSSAEKMEQVADSKPSGFTCVELQDKMMFYVPLICVFLVLLGVFCLSYFMMSKY